MTAACAPAKVHYFNVVPKRVCPGTPVKLEWKTAGRAKITAIPPLQPKSDRTYMPSVSTLFTLKAYRPLRKPAISQAQVNVHAASAEADELPFQARCEDGRLVATLDRQLTEWDPRLKVGTVVSEEDREMLVEHDGRQARVTAQDKTTNAFEGTSVGGAWRITAPLLPSERCGEVGTAPDRFFLVAPDERCENER